MHFVLYIAVRAFSVSRIGKQALKTIFECRVKRQ